jgi:predicted ester cyclase
MQNEQNKALVLQFYKAFDDRKIDQVLELLTPNFIAHIPGMLEPLDREGFKQFAVTFYLAFSQGPHIFDEVIVADDKVVTCGKFTARHIGEFQGLPPMGKQISLSIMHIDRIEDRKIAEHWGQGDVLGLMHQIGVTFLPL